MSVVGHDIPATLGRGERREVTLAIRNDGWDAWLSTPRPPETDCDGTGVAGSGCYRLGHAFVAGEVHATGSGLPPDPSIRYERTLFPRAVYPGEVVEVRLTLTAPDALGPHVLQLDGVQEMYTWFESAGNVPWQKRVEVVEPR